uniref:Putative gustatory receptor clone PTE03 n=1 Tax=Kryptolebias marmoratus TaxID=37003 RepID=A0A3Q2ZAM7_KRYMA
MAQNLQVVLVLQALNDSQTNRQIYFSFALTSYFFTVFVNLTLIAAVCLDKALHRPMYVFLCNLCFNGLCGASGFYLKLLADLLSGAHVISYVGCFTQMFVTYTYIFCQFSSLTVMAYDRYLAICQPLRYQAVMTAHRVALLLLLAWCFSLLETAVGVALIARLPLCSRHVARIFCTSWEVVKLSCSDTTANNLYGFTLMFLHTTQSALIMASYGQLSRAAARSPAHRRKFVQTCVPHLVSLLVFLASLLLDMLFSRYGGGSMAALQNALAAEVLVVPPIVNPVIYGMKLQQVRTRIRLRVTENKTLNIYFI